MDAEAAETVCAAGIAAATVVVGLVLPQPARARRAVLLIKIDSAGQAVLRFQFFINVSRTKDGTQERVHLHSPLCAVICCSISASPDYVGLKVRAKLPMLLVPAALCLLVSCACPTVGEDAAKPGETAEPRSHLT